MRNVTKVYVGTLAAALTLAAASNADENADKTPPAQTQPAQQMPMQQMQHMQGNMEQMHSLMAKIHATTDPKEREKLLNEHRQAMMAQMQMMHGMMGGGMGQGMGQGMGMKDGMHGQPGKDGPPMRGMMMQRMDMMQGMMEQMMEHMSAEHMYPESSKESGKKK